MVKHPNTDQYVGIGDRDMVTHIRSNVKPTVSFKKVVAAAAAAAAVVTGLVASGFILDHMANKGIEGCIADAENKAFLVYADGKIKREHMRVSNDVCTKIGDQYASYDEDYGLIDTKEILGQPEKYTLPLEFKLQI